MTDDQHLVGLNTRYLDPNVERKSTIIDKLVEQPGGIPLFSVVEISESGVCNRKCSFCPRSSPDYPEAKEFVSDGFIDRLSHQLAELNYSGLVLFSGFVEPLLDKKIHQHIRKIRQAVPRAVIELVTNGDPLTVKLLNKLADAGLSHLLVSLYDGPHQVSEIEELVSKTRFEFSRVVLRRRWVAEDGTVPISLSNRGGAMEAAITPLPSLLRALEEPCFYPAHQIFLDYNGDVLVCPHDWNKTAVVGNFNQQTLLEIWNGRKMNALRQKLINGDRGFAPCSGCNVNGTRTGRIHANAFQRSFNS